MKAKNHEPRWMVLFKVYVLLPFLLALLIVTLMTLAFAFTPR